MFKANSRHASGFNNQGPHYEGPMSEVFNLMIQSLIGGRKINYTSIVKSSMGNLDPETGYYNEGSCLYSMQMNESDFSSATTFHPLMGKDLKQFQPYFDDNLYIFSRYNVTGKMFQADFMSSFAHSFSPALWLLCCLFTLLFWPLFKMQVKFENYLLRKKRKMRDNSLYRLLAQLFQVDYFDSANISTRVTVFFMSIFSFCIFTYLSSTIKTDIVIVDEPKMINSYDDLLAKPRLRIIFPRIIDNFNLFEKAEANSKERRLWEKSLSEFNDNTEKMLFTFSGSSEYKMQFLKDAKRWAYDSNVETVVIVTETTKVGIRSLACLAKMAMIHGLFSSSTQEEQQGINFYSWLAKDANSPEHVLSFVHSAHYKSPHLTRVYKSVSWSYALGITVMLKLKSRNPPIELLKINNSKEGDTYRDCMADDYRENMPQVSHSAFTPVQFKTLFFILFTWIALAGYFLACERNRDRRARIMKSERSVFIRILHNQRN